MKRTSFPGRREIDRASSSIVNRRTERNNTPRRVLYSERNTPFNHRRAGNTQYRFRSGIRVDEKTYYDVGGNLGEKKALVDGTLVKLHAIFLSPTTLASLSLRSQAYSLEGHRRSIAAAIATIVALLRDPLLSQKRL